MEEEKIIFDDDGIEILDFDDDIIEESPILEETLVPEDNEEKELPFVEIPMFNKETPSFESVNVNDEVVNSVELPQIEIPKIEQANEINETIIENEKEDIYNNSVEVPIIEEETNKSVGLVQEKDDNVEIVSNSDLLNQTLRLNKEEIQNAKVSNDIIEDNLPVDNKTEDRKEKKTKRKFSKRGKSILSGILIFIILFAVIITLPFMSSIVNQRTTEEQNNQISNNNTNTVNKEFKSNIDVKKKLGQIKQYKNYQYQNINIISTKDNKEQLMSIKNNYIYSFNETKFEVYANKVIADFPYETKDYYEKLDDVYNLYVDDITTKTHNKRNTTSEEFDKLINMYPNVINYLIENYSVSEEKLLKVGNEEHVNITLKVSKEIVNYFSVETDRIKNKVDSTKLEQDFIYVDLLFDEDDNLYKIEIEIEDKNTCQETLEKEVESSILKYIFTDFNKTVDITIPSI